VFKSLWEILKCIFMSFCFFSYYICIYCILLNNVLSQFPRLFNNNLILGFSSLRWDFFQLFYHIKSINYLTKNDVLSVQPCRFGKSDEKLRTVGIWTRISHCKQVWLVKSKIEVFISEFLTINRAPTAAISKLNISTLSHKTCDNSMKRRTFVPQIISMWSCAERSKILNCLGNNLTKQTHYNSACILTIDRHVEEDLVCYLG